MNNNDVTLEEVRFVAEGLHDKNINPTIKNVREILRRGNEGTIGAFLKQVKTEWLLAKDYDHSDFSAAFKAAIVAEVRKKVKNAQDIARQEAKITEELFQEVCAANDRKDQRIKELEKDKESSGRKNQELERLLDAAKERQAVMEEVHSDLRATADNEAEKNRRLEAELAGVKEKLQTFEEKMKNLASDRDEAKGANERSREEITDLRLQLKSMEGAVSVEKMNVSNLQQQVSAFQKNEVKMQEQFLECQKEREISNQKVVLAEQKAAHSESILEDLRSRLRDQGEEFALEKRMRRELESKNTELLERLNVAEVRAAVARSNHEPIAPRSSSAVSKKREKRGSYSDGNSRETPT